MDKTILEAEKTVRDTMRKLREQQDLINNGQVKYQEITSKYEDVKNNEKKLSDVLDKTIKDLEAMKKEKETVEEELQKLKSTTPISYPRNDASSAPRTQTYSTGPNHTDPINIELLKDVFEDVEFHLDDALERNEEAIIFRVDEDDGNENDEDNRDANEGEHVDEIDGGEEYVGHENDGDMRDENEGENVDEIDGGEEDETPNAILAQCLQLLSVENHVQLVSMLMRYKQQKDGQKEAIEVSSVLKKKRQECRKEERKLKEKIEQNEHHQRQYIDEKGYPKVVDSVKKPRPGKRQR